METTRILTPDKSKDTAAFMALVAFVVVSYTVPAEWIPGAQVLRPALATSALAAGLTFLGFLGRREPLHLDGVKGVALLLLVGLAYASMAWSVYPSVTTETVLELVKLVAIYLTVVNIVTTERRLVQIVSALVLASIVASVGVLQWHHAGVDLVEGYRARWVGVFSDSNIMAKNLGLVVPIALAFLVRNATPWLMRVGCALAAGLAITAVILSHSRGGFVGLSVATFIWVLRERNLLRTIAVGVAVGAVLVFAPASFWNRTDTVTDFRHDASAMGRVNAWKVTAEVNKDRPLLGVGAGAFRYAWPLYAPPDARRAYMAHNVFLQVLAELGVVGFFLFLAFVGAATGGAFEASRDPEIGWLSRAIAASIVGYLVCDLFSGELASTHAYLLFSFGSCAARLAGTRRSAHDSPQPAFGAAVMPPRPPPPMGMLG